MADAIAIEIADPIHQRLKHLRRSIPAMLRALGATSIADLKAIVVGGVPRRGAFIGQSPHATSRTLTDATPGEQMKYRVRIQGVPGDGQDEGHLFFREIPFNSKYILLKVLKDINYPLEYVPTEISTYRSDDFRVTRDDSWPTECVNFVSDGLPAIVKRRYGEEAARYGKRWTDLEVDILGAASKLRDLRRWKRSLNRGNLARHPEEGEASALLAMPERGPGNLVSSYLANVKGVVPGRTHTLSTEQQIEKLLRILNPALDGILNPPFTLEPADLRARAERAYTHYLRKMEHDRLIEQSYRAGIYNGARASANAALAQKYGANWTRALNGGRRVRKTRRLRRT